MPVTKACERCGKAFTVKTYRAATARACSKPCADQLLRKGTPPPDGMKWCNAGAHFMPTTDFSKNSKAGDGLYHKCKTCGRAFYEANRVQRTQRMREYWAANRESVTKKKRECWHANKEENKRRGKEYRERNAEEIKRRGKEKRETDKLRFTLQSKRSYERHRDSRLQRVKDYARKHPEVVKASSNNRRAREKAAPGRCTPGQWLAKCEFFGWRCYLCGEPLVFKTAIVEHRTPLARGGSNWPANLAPACAPCNRSKGTKTEAEYRTLLSKYRAVA